MEDEEEVPFLANSAEQEENAKCARRSTKSSTTISIHEEIEEMMKVKRDEKVNENKTDNCSNTMDSKSKSEEFFPLLLTQPCTSSSTKEEEMYEKQEASHSDPSGSERIAPTSNTASFSDYQGNQSSLEMKPTAPCRSRGNETVTHNVVSRREDEENTLGPVDVLSFAWQISKGMV